MFYQMLHLNEISNLMANIKVLLRVKTRNGEIPDPNKEFPIALRFIQRRKAKYTYLGHTSSLKNWDEKSQQVRKSHPQYHSLKVLIATKKSEAERTLIDLEIRQPVFSLEQLKKKVGRATATKSFFEFAEDYVEEIVQRKKINVARSEKSRIAGLRKFFKGREIEFYDLDVATLGKLKTYLTAEGKSAKTINNYLIMIRTIFNKAIREGLVEREYYPFGGRDKIQLRQVDGKKIGLDEFELDKIRQLKLEEDSGMWHARNVFLLSFNFAGVRIGDLLRLRWDSIQGNRLLYEMGKTLSKVSIPISEEAQEILSYYEKHKRSYNDVVLPYLKEVDWTRPEDIESKVNSATSNINKRLKGIAKRATIHKSISNHISRHTFGNISGDKIPTPILQKLYRHKSLNTTAVYQGNFIHKDTDDALLKVLQPESYK
jgi:integrase/recombinase XerD